MLCIRKVKNFDDYARDPRVQRVLESDASLLVPHWEDEFKLPETLMPRATYVGHIVKALPVDPESVQTKLNLLGKRVIVISAGGGGGSGTIDYFNYCLNAFAYASKKMNDLVALLIAGPLFTEWEHLRLGPAVRVLPFDFDFTSTCATADLVLSQAGYNSMNELAALGTPTICIPAERGFDDQHDRARSMAEIYPNLVCFDGTREEDLASLIIARLIQPVTRIRSAVPDGAYRAASHVMNVVNRQKI